MPLQNDSGSRANIGRSSVLQNSENNLKASSGRLSVSQNSDSAPKETKSTACTCGSSLSAHFILHLIVIALHISYLHFLVFSYHNSASVVVPSTPQRAGIGSNTKSVGNSAFASGGTTLKRSSLRSNNASNLQNFNKVDVVPVIVPRTSSVGDFSTDSKSDGADAASILSKATRRVESTTDSKKENSDVEPVMLRASSRVDIASDSAPTVVSKASRRLEPATDSKKESTDVAPAVIPRAASRMEMASDSAPVFSKASRRVESAPESRRESSDVAPVVIPRASSRMEMTSDSRREPSAGRVSPFRIQSRYAELRKQAKVDAGSKNTDTDDFNCQIYLPRRNGAIQTINAEETREDVKHGAVDRMGYFNSAEPNTSLRSENCMMHTLIFSFLCAILPFDSSMAHNR